MLPAHSPFSSLQIIFSFLHAILLWVCFCWNRSFQIWEPKGWICWYLRNLWGWSRLKLLLCWLCAAKPLHSPPSSQKSSKAASQRRLLPSHWEHNIVWYAAIKENLSPKSVRETERFPSHLTLAVFSNYHFTHMMLFIRLGLNRCNQD